MFSFVCWLFVFKCICFDCAHCVVGSTVEGNAGPEIDKKVREDLVNMRTVHMEYDIFSVSTM